MFPDPEMSAVKFFQGLIFGVNLKLPILHTKIQIFGHYLLIKLPFFGNMLLLKMIQYSHISKIQINGDISRFPNDLKFQNLTIPKKYLYLPLQQGSLTGVNSIELPCHKRCQRKWGPKFKRRNTGRSYKEIMQNDKGKIEQKYDSLA